MGWVRSLSSLRSQARPYGSAGERPGHHTHHCSSIFRLLKWLVIDGLSRVRARAFLVRATDRVAP